MGRSAREKPRKLGKKLRAIRVQILGLSQTQMAKALKLKVDYSAISQYENGKREPSLLILLRYSKLGTVTLEQILDDKLSL
jgi:transcriptional regulator with XRE-family HTH domain